MDTSRGRFLCRLSLTWYVDDNLEAFNGSTHCLKTEVLIPRVPLKRTIMNFQLSGEVSRGTSYLVTLMCFALSF